MGFKAVTHFDHDEPFAALYRDGVEIIVVQAKYGQILSNKKRFGAGYDVYIALKQVEGVDALYAEFKRSGARIESPPTVTRYGCYEFVVQDIDGHRIGIGRIKRSETFFKDMQNC